MFGRQKAAGSESASRRQTRSRKVSQRLAVVDAASRAEAAAARLEALEADNAGAAPDPFGLAAGDDDDEEFVIASDGEEEEELPGKRKRKRAGPKRKTRGMLNDAKVPRSFARLLEESGIEAPRGGGGAAAAGAAPTYLTAAMGPSKLTAPRKFCSVCGFESPYTCARCGSRFCTRRCYAVHTETRCLKFIS